MFERDKQIMEERYQQTTLQDLFCINTKKHLFHRQNNLLVKVKLVYVFYGKKAIQDKSIVVTMNQCQGSWIGTSNIVNNGSYYYRH